MTPLQKSILNTLIYADVFNYPLTLKQIHAFLISSKPYSLQEVKSALKKLDHLKNHNHYYFLNNRQSIVKTRQIKTYHSTQKLKLAQKAVKALSKISTIKLIAITGALSMNNSNQSDDIDLIIITKPNTLWTTRLFAILLLELLKIRRRPNDKNPQDKICLNLFLTTNNLKIAKNRHNLYTAHEVVQIKPLLNQDKTYESFLYQNRWVKKYLANFSLPTEPILSSIKTNSSFIEKLSYKLQHFYMKNKITNEKVSSSQAFFHPRQTSQIVLKQYQQKLKTYL